LAMCVAVAWGSNTPLTSPIPATCAILDINWKLWDVSTSYFNSSDDWGPLAVNLCLDMERSCAHTTNEPCSICQYRPSGSGVDSYCLGYSKGEVYVPLDETIVGSKGFMAVLTGDDIYCDKPRTSYVTVLCNQPSNGLKFDGESVNPPCTYNFTLSLTQDCTVSAASFTPTFTITSITPNSFTVTIDDGYAYEFWNYNVKVNGKYGYQGSHRDILIENLDPGTTYNVIVERDSGAGAILDVISPSVTLSVTTLPNNLGSFHTAVVSGTGTGIFIGLIIASAFIVVVFGFLKLRQTEWWADKFGGSGRPGGKSFSLLDAEKSNAFDS